MSIDNADQPLAADAVAASAPPISAPRIRWASIVWGVVFAAIASVALWFTTADDRREQFSAWTSSLTPATLGGGTLLAIGILALLLGVLGLIRRAQHRSAD